MIIATTGPHRCVWCGLPRAGDSVYCGSCMLRFDEPTPKIIPLGAVIGSPNVSDWAIQPTVQHVPFPFRVVVHSRRARLLRVLTRGRIQAVALGDSVLVAERYPDPDLLAHEAVHAWQFWREAGGSLILFLSMYAALLLKHGYHDHPWEIDAKGLAPRIARRFVSEHSE